MAPDLIGNFVLTTLPNLPKREHETLLALAEYVDKYGTYPTHKQLAEELGVKAVSSYFDRLEKRALLGRLESAGRGHKITKAGIEYLFSTGYSPKGQLEDLAKRLKTTT
jgi:Mn-dependent DtxR family transcriptional regulator